MQLPPPPRPYLAWGLIWLTSGATLILLDLTWLGVIAKDHYQQALGPLMRSPVYWPAAWLFYGMYTSFVVFAAVMPAPSHKAATARGGAMGAFAYGTYELTNWAVISGWPARIVGLDIAWGVVITGAVALTGSVAKTRLTSPGPATPPK